MPQFEKRGHFAPYTVYSDTSLCVFKREGKKVKKKKREREINEH